MSSPYVLPGKVSETSFLTSNDFEVAMQNAEILEDVSVSMALANRLGS